MESLISDLRLALRTFRRKPLFALIAVASIAVGIGANTAVFTVVNTLLIRPVPGVQGMDRVMELGRTSQGRGFDTFTYPDFTDLRDAETPFESVAAWRFEGMSLTEEGASQRLNAIAVSPAYFDVLGLTPHAGRFFLPEEDRSANQQAVVVLGHGFWQRQFGGDPRVVGASIVLNRESYEVLGIAPAGFGSHIVGLNFDVFVPFLQLGSRSETLLTNRRASWFFGLGRLGPGSTWEEGAAAVATVFGRLAEAYPETNRGRGADARPLGPVPAGGRVGVAGFLTVMMGLVGLVLLLTCANVAGMFLARGVAREREIAVRLALGSARRRLFRQLVTESGVVFFVGGLAGLLLATWVMGVVDVSTLPLPIEIRLDFGPDWRIFLFALSATGVAGVVFGSLPALRATRPDLVPSLRSEGSGGPSGNRLRGLFVAGQIAVSLVLLTAAGLFMRSLQVATAADAGFDAAEVYMTSLDLSLEGVETDEEGILLYERILERVRALPGASSSAMSIDLPLDLGSNGTGVIPEGVDPASEDPYLRVDFNQVTDAYFDVLSIPLLRGRYFDETDVAVSEKVAIVSREFARAFGEEAVLGSRFRYGTREGDWYTVVGVVEDVKNQTVTEKAKPFVYTLLAQNFNRQVNVLLRAAGDAATVGMSLREAVLEVDPSLSLTPVVSVVELTGIGTLPQRLAASVTSVLGLVALFLSGIGVYGVVAFAVASRTREIGIRMAIGASASRILSSVFGWSFRLTAPGVLVGVVASAGLARVLRFLLLGVSPFDPRAFGAVGFLLIAVVALATLLPAFRASSVDPVDALRAE